jgi:hypothetical protein
MKQAPLSVSLARLARVKKESRGRMNGGSSKPSESDGADHFKELFCKKRRLQKH